MELNWKTWTLGGVVATVGSLTAAMATLGAAEPYLPLVRGDLGWLRGEWKVELASSRTEIQSLKVQGLEGQLRQLQTKIDNLTIERSKAPSPFVTELLQRAIEDSQLLETQRVIEYCVKWSIDKPSMPCIQPPPIVRVP